MKNIVKLFSILFLVSGVVFISCTKPNEEEKEKVDAPTKLSVTDVTEISANFTWKGSADSYEIEVGSKTYNQKGTSLSLIDLTDGTKYTWKVRAKKGSEYSDWVDGSDFTTGALKAGEISVYFGSEHWTAPSKNAIYQEITSDGESLVYICAIHPSATSSKPFPMVAMFVYSSGVTTLAEEGGYRFEYTEQGFLDATKVPPFGDWWKKSGTVTITSNSNSKVSGIAVATMFDAYQKYVDPKTDDPETRTLTVVFKDVNLLKSSSIAPNGFIGTAAFENASINANATLKLNGFQSLKR